MKVREVPMSEWNLLPPPPDACQVCGRKHGPEAPHDPTSLHWQTARRIAGEPAPTWAEALAPLPAQVREQWIAGLAAHGVVVDA